VTDRLIKLTTLLYTHATTDARHNISPIRFLTSARSCTLFCVTTTTELSLLPHTTCYQATRTRFVDLNFRKLFLFVFFLVIRSDNKMVEFFTLFSHILRSTLSKLLSFSCGTINNTSARSIVQKYRSFIPRGHNTVVRVLFVNTTERHQMPLANIVPAVQHIPI